MLRWRFKEKTLNGEKVVICRKILHIKSLRKATYLRGVRPHGDDYA